MEDDPEAPQAAQEVRQTPVVQHLAVAVPREHTEVGASTEVARPNRTNLAARHRAPDFSLAESSASALPP